MAEDFIEQESTAETAATNETAEVFTEPEPKAEDENFAELFEQSTKQSGRLNPGQKIETTVVGITGDYVYVDLGGKSEGVIAVSEFVDEAGNITVQAGDTIKAFFVTVENGMKKLTTFVKGYSTVTLAGIRDAFEAGVPVTGKVTREIKGGFEVMIGKVRAFCPFSQIDLKGSRTSDTYIGLEFPFRVLEFKESDANIILTRRALLEEEREMQLAQLRESIEVGQEREARVRSVQKFGVFVDLGGLDGFIPVSELLWGNVDDPASVVSVGQTIVVKVKTIDWGRNRLTLSLKDMQEDPWNQVAEKYIVDSTVSGTIVRLTPFGAFVNLEPGIDGLIHVSKLGAGRRIKHPKEVVEVGQAVEAFITGVDAENRRISLSMEQAVQKPEIQLPSVGDVLDVVVERVMPYGIFVRSGENVKGLIPNAEMGTLRGTNHTKLFPEGTQMQVIVIDTDESRGKVTFSRSKVDEQIEQDDIKRYKEKVEKEEKSSGSLGSLGELLKAKLGNFQ